MSSNNVIYVIDDDESARDSLTFLLKSAGMSVRAYESATAFLNDRPEAASGCIITDVRMPDMNGIELLKKLEEAGSELPVIVVTGHGDIQLAVEAMKAGASEFIEKPFNDEVMLRAVKESTAQSQKSAHRNKERARIRECLASLSNREREVLEGLVAGKANKIIAFNLQISPRTVEIYRAHVMHKMHAKSLSDLVRMTLLADLPYSSEKSSEDEF